MRKILAVCTTAFLAVGLALVGASPAAATGNHEGESKKVFVCKYVGKPGVDERLQIGNNPISVSVNSIKGPVFTGAEFADAHSESIVISWDNTKGGGQEGEPSISDCPAPVGPPVVPEPPKVPAKPEVTVKVETLHDLICEVQRVNVVTRTTTTDWKLVGNAWVEDIRTVEIIQAREATVEECPVTEPPAGEEPPIEEKPDEEIEPPVVVEPPIEEPPVVVAPPFEVPAVPTVVEPVVESPALVEPVKASSTVERLPETGGNTTGTLYGVGAAFLLLLAGAAALLFKRREATE